MLRGRRAPDLGIWIEMTLVQEKWGSGEGGMRVLPLSFFHRFLAITEIVSHYEIEREV